MSSSNRRSRKKRQTRLTFEPAASPSSPQAGGSLEAPAGGSSFEPANVRYSQNATYPMRRRRPNSKVPTGSETTYSQSTLSGNLGNSKASGPSQAAHFMPRAPGTQRPTDVDSSDESVIETNAVGRDDEDDEDADDLFGDKSVTVPEVTFNGGDEDEGEGEEDDDPPIPTPRNPRSSQSAPARSQRMVVLDDSDEDEEDDVPIIPRSSLRRKRPATIDLDSSDDEANDVVSPAKRRRIAPSSSRTTAQESDDEIQVTNTTTPRRRLQRPTQTTSSSPSRKIPHKGHRSEHQKKMELLRRRRQGEKIDELTESESDTDNGPRGVYDTDSDDGLQVLKDFDDEESESEDQVKEKKGGKNKKNGDKNKKKKASKPQQQKETNTGDDEDNLDDFVVEDDSDEPLGAPASIPLEFTSQAHKPLKDQFPFVVEWLVHNRINPAFERRDPVYQNAWRKLDDSFRGLASSKFASSAWKPDFYRTLKGRPCMEAYEIECRDDANCMACGRSGHPSTRKIIFQGAPYNKQTLEDVEQPSSSDSEDDGDESENSDSISDTASIDTQGARLPPQNVEWLVGKVCCSNAETAHRLLHWKHALKSWVEERLTDDGWMTEEKIAAREKKMKASKKKKLANRITDGWKNQGIISSLYRDFKITLEEATNQSTTGRGRGGGGWK